MSSNYFANGETVFGSFANVESGAAGAIDMSRSQGDYIFFDMEHGALDMNEMRHYMQYLLDPAKILRRGRPGTDIAIWVRIPANGREMNEWMIKNALDQGAHGIIAPHIETAEQALHLVRSMRYPQRLGSSDMEPEGLRGSGPGNAVRYWGVSGADYIAKADVWPLDPNGELLNMIQIENKIGISNVDEIAKVPGVSMLMAAPGDLGMAYGGDANATEEAIQTVLRAATAAGLPCAITANADNVEQRIREGFRVLIGGPEMIAVGRRAAGRD
ncbi:MAG: 5-keto-4-deoxy-D-glucarate aldolase [Acidobacteriota bacterium]|nr:MAG: 5-keto-4-deoxy-D-glucarate aldolase [Acidobacteriota bacterium]